MGADDLLAYVRWSNESSAFLGSAWQFADGGGIREAKRLLSQHTIHLGPIIGAH